MEYVDTDTRLGHDVVTPGIRKHLEKYFSQASPEDKARCLELLNALDIKREIDRTGRRTPGPPTPQHPHPEDARPKRPHTAMANLDRPRASGSAYSTTYTREYSNNLGPSAVAERPRSTRAFQATYELSAPIGTSTYGAEYWRKEQRRTLPMRTGSASGNRRNNPHPLETFMVWRFPQRAAQEQKESEWSRPLTDEVMDQAIRGQLKSTYQQDYLGIPQGYQVQSAYAAPTDWKSKVPYTLDTSTRATYRAPQQQPELKGNTLRYGCNTTKTVAASGVVPATYTLQKNIKTRTTYEREYLDPVAPKTYSIRELGRQYGAQALQKYLANARGQDKENIARMIRTLNVHPPSRSRPLSTSRQRPVLPPTTCLTDANSSDWHNPVNRAHVESLDATSS